MSEGLWQDLPAPEFKVPELPEPGTEEAIQAAQDYIKQRLGVDIPLDSISIGARAYERKIMDEARGTDSQKSAGLRSIHTNLAIEAFRALEQKRFQLEIKEYALEKALTGDIDMDRYVSETEWIRTQFEHRRAEYRGRGLLSGD